MSSTSHNRQPAGQPIGGQFAATARAESNVQLSAPQNHEVTALVAESRAAVREWVMQSGKSEYTTRGNRLADALAGAADALEATERRIAELEASRDRLTAVIERANRETDSYNSREAGGWQAVVDRVQDVLASADQD